MNAASPQSTDPRVAAYLDGLAQALGDLPEPVRTEVYDEIRQHIDDELALRPDDLTAVPEVLDRLGDPVDIATEARSDRPAGVPVAGSLLVADQRRVSRMHEIIALLLLEGGGLLGLIVAFFHSHASAGALFVLGLLIGALAWIVGVVLLWTSRHYTLGDKLCGTLLIPGGFSGTLLFVAATGGLATTSSSCTGGAVEVGTRNGHVVHTQNIAPSCTGGGVNWIALGIVIALLLVAVAGPIYTTARLGGRVSAM